MMERDILLLWLGVLSGALVYALVHLGTLARRVGRANAARQHLEGRLVDRIMEGEATYNRHVHHHGIEQGKLHGNYTSEPVPWLRASESTSVRAALASNQVPVTCTAYVTTIAAESLAVAPVYLPVGVALTEREAGSL